MLSHIVLRKQYIECVLFVANESGVKRETKGAVSLSPGFLILLFCVLKSSPDNIYYYNIKLRLKINEISNIIMYFVVCFTDTKKYLVIPQHWLFDYKTALQKFINYSLNSNQTFMGYYANNIEPKHLSQHAPNFRAPYVHEFPFEGAEGRFDGRMKRFFSEYFVYICYLIKVLFDITQSQHW